MPVNVEAIDGDDDQYRESLLNSAVEYPEALAYLLERGANPDRQNAFGKTPLMYAAQHNALPSAKLLLDHGANPNLATVQPRDTCYYQLETTSVTALHYAVRYASADLVELLLDGGAAIFAQAHGFPYGGDHRPLDWLRRYTAVDAEERNGNIHAREVRPLTARLTLPDARTLESWSLELTIRAEAEYAAGEAAKANETLRLALQASPNQRALSDMSLIALRAGYPNQAVSSAWQLTRSTDRRLLANGWFNLGLACEALERTHNDYCPPAPPTSFVRAWLVEPTPARAEKLLRTIEKHTSCVETRTEGIYRYVLPKPELFTNRPPRQFYVSHPHGADLASRDLQWRALDRPDAKVRIIGRYELGDITLTELESPGDIGLPAAGTGFACDPPLPAG